MGPTTENFLSFGRDFSRSHMPKYKSELLTIAIRRQGDLDDLISKELVGKGLFKKIPNDSFCRQYIFAEDEFKERSLQEIQETEKPTVDAIKFIIFWELTPNYFRISYDGAQNADMGQGEELIGQGREIEAEWNGQSFILNRKADHLEIIT